MSKITDSAIEGMREKLELLEETLKRLKEEGAEASVDDTSESEDGRPVDDVTVTEKKENDKAKDVNKDEKPTTPKKEGEGEPADSNALANELHPLLANMWNALITNGIAEQEKDQLLEKYKRPQGLEPPEVNEVVAALMSESQKKRDEYLAETQRLIGSAIVALGAAISLRNVQERKDKLALLVKINDAAKLICEVQHRKTEFRRSVIMEKGTERVQQLLSQTKPDTFLFGEDLGERIKQFKASQKPSPKNSRPANDRDRSQDHAGNSNCKDVQQEKRLSEQDQAGSSGSSIQARPRPRRQSVKGMRRLTKHPRT